MVSIINLGKGGGSNTMQTILLIGLTAGIGYLLYKQFAGSKPAGTPKTEAGSSISDFIGDSGTFLSQSAQDQGSGLDLGTMENYQGEADITESLWNFSTGIWKANPLTFGTGHIYDYITQNWINPYVLATQRRLYPTPKPDTPIVVKTTKYKKHRIVVRADQPLTTAGNLPTFKQLSGAVDPIKSMAGFKYTKDGRILTLKGR